MQDLSDADKEMGGRRGMSKKCESCVHRTRLGNGNGPVACYYIVNTGKRRSCPPGKKCTVYEKGDPKTLSHDLLFMDGMIYRGRCEDWHKDEEGGELR